MTSSESGLLASTTDIPVASSETRELHRGIGTRQLSMIAIGGAIGTGLFFASGGAIAQAGPGGALLAYATMGIAVYCMMQSLGEMATQLPIPGSFEAYAERFIDPSLGFAVGWNYWFSWSITLAAELVAGALIVQFWFPHSNSTLWAMGFFAVLLALWLRRPRALPGSSGLRSPGSGRSAPARCAPRWPSPPERARTPTGPAPPPSTSPP